MKHQHHGLTVNTEKQWPIEDLREKIDIQHVRLDQTGNGNPMPSMARSKVGLASEHYHRAVAEMAYGYWEKRGHSHGASEADWLKAEAALKPHWSADLSFASMEPESETPGRNV